MSVTDVGDEGKPRLLLKLLLHAVSEDGGPQVLNSADEAELNFMLGGRTINCAALVEVAKTETMEMLTAFRLQELSIPSR